MGSTAVLTKIFILYNFLKLTVSPKGVFDHAPLRGEAVCWEYIYYYASPGS